MVGAVVEFERARCWSECSEFWWARVRARRRLLRCRARASAEGGSPKMKNLMKQKMSRAMESWPRRKPWVKERLAGGLEGVEWGEVGMGDGRHTRSPGRGARAPRGRLRR